MVTLEGCTRRQHESILIELDTELADLHHWSDVKALLDKEFAYIFKGNSLEAGTLWYLRKLHGTVIGSIRVADLAGLRRKES